MSESSKYDAQKKKLDGLCEEHDLTYRLRHDRYPITLTIKPLTGVSEQLSMLEEAETKDYISPDASLVIYRKDGELAMKVSGTFTISEALRNKFKNIYVKLCDFWLQYFFRDIMEKGLLKGARIPVIDEAEADDSGDEDEDEEEDGHDPGNVDDAEDDPEEEDGEDASTDDLIAAATQLVRAENKATVSMLQRRLKIGYARACRIMQTLEETGVVGPYRGSEPREVLPYDIPEEG